LLFFTKVNIGKIGDFDFQNEKNIPEVFGIYSIFSQKTSL